MGAGAWLKAVHGLWDKPNGEGWFVLTGPWLCPLAGRVPGTEGRISLLELSTVAKGFDRFPWETLFRFWTQRGPCLRPRHQWSLTIKSETAI